MQSFPAGGRKWQISTDGGRWPQWARNGREIFYRNRNAMMAAAFAAPPDAGGTGVTVGKPELLFEGPFEEIFSLTPDERFVVIQIDSDESAPTQVHVVLDWLEELKRRSGSVAARVQPPRRRAITAAVPALRAARIDQVRALRQEPERPGNVDARCHHQRERKAEQRPVE